MSIDKVLFIEEMSEPIKDMIMINKKINYDLIEHTLIFFNDKIKCVERELGEIHEELAITNPSHANFIYNARAYHNEILLQLNTFLSHNIKLNTIDKPLVFNFNDILTSLTASIISNFLNVYFKSIMIHNNQRLDKIITNYTESGKDEILNISNYFHKYIGNKYQDYDIQYLSLILPWNYTKRILFTTDTLYFDSTPPIISLRKLYENSTIDKFCDINAIGYIFNFPIFIIKFPDLNEKYKCKLSYNDIADDEDFNYSPETLNDL